MAVASDVNLALLATRTEGFTGADVAALCSEAAYLALREDMASPTVAARHFDAAIASVRAAEESAQMHARPGLTPTLVL